MLAIVMNKESEWTLEPWHVRVAFRKAGIVVPEEAITLPEKKISGPDLNLEGKDFVVTVTVMTFFLLFFVLIFLYVIILRKNSTLISHVGPILC